MFLCRVKTAMLDKELLAKAETLLKNADCVIANHSEAMGSKKSKVAVVDKKNTEWISGNKKDISRKILEKVASEMN